MLMISFGFGFGLTVSILIVGSVSGSHVNPVVSFGLWIAGKFNAHDLVAYWIAQFIGAIGVSLCALFLINDGSIGQMITDRSAMEAFKIEVIMTFLFVMWIMIVVSRCPKSIIAQAILIGGALGLIIYFAGASMNPALATAPVVVAANPIAAEQIWIYIAGPFLGAGIAGVFGKYLRLR